MNKDYKILVMMATYNGEKYLRQQLDSIINQSYNNFDLIISDDFSNDNTINILEEYMKKDSRIKIINNLSNYRGAYFNFFSLINYVKKYYYEYDFYMFSDQDDIWDYNKISNYIEFFETKRIETYPVLIYGDMRIINKDNVVISNSINKMLGIKYNNDKSVFLAHNVFGCNTFFNKYLLNILPIVDINSEDTKILSHDNFIAKYAAFFGEIIYYEFPTMSYRRYENNVTSKHQYNFSFKKLIDRIFNLSHLSKDHALTYNQTLITINYMKSSEIFLKREEELQIIEDIIHKGGFFSVYNILKLKIYWGSGIKSLSRIFIILTKKYKKYIFIK